MTEPQKAPWRHYREAGTMKADLEFDVVTTLSDAGLLPADHIALFVAGSRVRGWGNADSDLDIYIVCRNTWPGPGSLTASVMLEPNYVSYEVRTIGRIRWDVQYWVDTQVDQMLGKVSWDGFDSSFSPSKVLTALETDFLERLSYAVPASGEEWLAKRRQQLSDSAIRPILTAQATRWTNTFIEDALGQLAAGDLESATLSARLVLGSAVKAYLADNGKLAQSAKWMARQFREIEQGPVTFDEYWALETMRRYDPDHPARWISDVIAFSRKVVNSVRV